MWIEFVSVFCLAFALSLFFTPRARKLALKFHVVEKSSPRKKHKRIITCVGGLAIYIAFIISLLFSFLFFPKILNPLFSFKVVGLLIGATIILIMGLTDDIKEISGFTKVSLQIVAALVTSAIFDIKITYLILPVLGKVSFGIFSIPFTILWVVGLTNAINWIDGLDGLAAGVSSIVSLSFLFISLREGDYVTAILIVALVGATIGFLKYNFYPAKVFMGDTGSNFLGFMLANIAIIGSLKSAAVLSLAVPILILGVPIFDTLFSVWRRIRLKRNPIKPDRDHFHHRLLKLGFGHRQAVLIIYAISGVLSFCAIILDRNPNLTSLAIVVFIIGIIGVILWRLKLFSLSFRE